MKIEEGRGFEGDFLPDSEGPVLDFTRDRFNLILKFNGISQREIEAFRTGERFRFGLFLPTDAVFLLVEAPGVMEWADAPYSVATLPKDAWPLSAAEPLEPGGLTLKVVLLEGKTFVVKAVREFALGREFSRKLLRHVAELARQEVSAVDFVKRAQAIQRLYSTPQMLMKATIVVDGSAPRLQ